MWNPDLFQRTLRFAAEAHAGQTVPGSGLPYLLHLSAVCMEALNAVIDGTGQVDFTIQLALLHDTVEDTAVTPADLERHFGPPVAAGVLALTKNASLPREERMADSLTRIREQPPEVAIVKMADRITNLQPPPAHWSAGKRLAYREEARVILDSLRGVNPYIEQRLEMKILAYESFLME